MPDLVMRFRRCCVPLVAFASVVLGLVLGWAVLDRAVIEQVSTVELLGVVALAVLPVGTAWLCTLERREPRSVEGGVLRPAGRDAPAGRESASGVRGAADVSRAGPGGTVPGADAEGEPGGWRRPGRPERVRHAGPGRRTTAGR